MKQTQYPPNAFHDPDPEHLTDEITEEDFLTAQARGTQPEDYTADPLFAQKYRDWLRRQSN